MTERIAPERIVEELGAWSLGDVTAELILPGGVAADCFLVTAGDDRYVAKLHWDSQENADRGLLCAELLAEHGLRTGKPVRTPDGAVSVMMDSVGEHRHPLALLDFVPGTPTSDAAILGDILGRIHAVLVRHGDRLPVERRELAYLDYLRNWSVPIAQEDWVKPAVARAVADAEAFERSTDVTYAVGVFDGPELLVDGDGTVGLIDFGVVGWQPVLYAVANQLMHIGEPDPRVYLEAYARHMTLPEAEWPGLAVYHRVCAAIYAKYGAYRLQNQLERGGPLEEVEAGLQQLRAALES